MNAISAGSKRMQSVEKIALGNNRITPRGAQNIIPCLNSNLLHLDLQNNNIGKIGCELIANFLKTQSKSFFYLE